jgi:hypothetical protein
MNITIEIDTSEIADVVRTVVEGDGYLTHSAVQDTIEEHLKDNDYVTRDDVDTGVTEDDVERMIDSALDRYTPENTVSEDDVERIVDAAIDAADNQDVRDLERRFELYAQKVDHLTGQVRSLEQGIEALENQMGALGGQVNDLGARTAQTQDLFDLLRRAAEIILGR